MRRRLLTRFCDGEARTIVLGRVGIRGAGRRAVPARTAAAAAIAQGARRGPRRTQPDDRAAGGRDDRRERNAVGFAGAAARRPKAVGSPAAAADAWCAARRARLPDARLHPVRLAPDESSGAISLALPRRSPSRSGSGQHDRTSLSFRRAGARGRLSGAADPAVGHRRRHAAPLAATAHRVRRLSPQ